MGSRLRKNVHLLYECLCEVSDAGGTQEPSIIRNYPETYKNAEELKVLPKFAFPCKFDRSIVHHYSFVLTSLKSKYTYCFCRYDPKKETCLVVMSHLPWHEIFYKLLNTAAALQKVSDMEFLSFLVACRVRPPMPGQTMNVTYNADQSVFTCECPHENQLPTIPGNINLTEYFSAVDANCMVGLWAALLNERRVAVVASKPSRLSATVQAANATLYPMSWQHIYIPILPEHLVDYLSAPMPFLVGVPRSVMEIVKLSDIGDVVILDVDKNELKTAFNDLETLPSEVVSNLKKELSDKNALGDAVSRAFVRALVLLIGGYSDAIRIETGELITFNRGAFIKTRRHMEPFLQKILESQNFNQFIQERLDLLNSGRGFSDEFEIECYNYAERTSGGSGQTMKQQYKDWVKTMKRGGGAVLKSVKEKANPAVRSAVLTVRQGGRNVRSAVQGFKIKLPHKNSSRSSMNSSGESRFSYESEGAAASGSRPSTPPPRGPLDPPGGPLDLLGAPQPHHTGSPLMLPLPNTLSARSSATLPPRLPARPSLPSRYPIVPTARLLETADAPPPPPRAGYLASGTSKFYSSVTSSGAPMPRAGPIHFKQVKSDPKGLAKAEGKPSAWKVEARRPVMPTNSIESRPGSESRPSAQDAQDRAPDASLHGNTVECRLALHSADSRLPPARSAALKATRSAPSAAHAPSASLPLAANTLKNINIINRKQEVTEEESDLIQLDAPLISFQEFDPLRSAPYRASQPSSDKDLLQEYGLDFSRFGFDDFEPSLLDIGSSVVPDNASNGESESPSQSKPSLPQEWTKFN